MKPRFYSKEAIGILTLFLSPFFGCILFSYNLREVGKGRLSPLFIIAGLFFTFIIKLLTNGLDSLFQLAIANILGSLLLTYYCWDKYLDGYTYEKKNFWKPALIFVGICVGLIVLQLLTSPKR